MIATSTLAMMAKSTKRKLLCQLAVSCYGIATIPQAQGAQAMFKLQIETFNAAFDDRPSYEIGQLLVQIGRQLQDEELHVGDSVPIYDDNGNHVGEFVLE